MKSEEQITARIRELRDQLKPRKDNPERHRRGQKDHRGNLGIRRIRELEGEISGLEWVLKE